MFWLFLIAALVAGGSAAIMRKIAPLMAIAVPLGLLALGAQWINDRDGVSKFLLDSWKSVGGIKTSEDLQCGPHGASIPVLLLLLLGACFGFLSVLCLGLGPLVALVGSLHTLCTGFKQYHWLAFGLAMTAIGFALVFLTGGCYRLDHLLVVHFC